MKVQKLYEIKIQMHRKKEWTKILSQNKEVDRGMAVMGIGNKQ